ncbi:MAG: bifunctional UDP-N-acetylmuramoyl-tripeptide:D-alanyl-D-alanine ligase/alanine racemase [Cyclobacteriaceae bacterium]|nr:bifunctional UDP-N-acetylmuramoyl-tripeptide:D-alanyl-D-alanine ligase/alanine racemase [Cyclobacteriaceae bacterium]
MFFSQVQNITGGEVLQLREDMPVDHLLVDSRKLILTKGSMFFAIRGERYDGHQFIPELYDAGIRQFVVGTDVDLARIPAANVIRVQQPLQALQALARTHREGFSGKVIGITGSNGKTVIKEWLYQLLVKDYAITKNPGSYNSQVGVPLSVWRIQPNDELCLFEAGISQPGEMARLERIIQPTIGIFTNIGPAHDAGFASREAKADEKAKLFANSEVTIYCADHDEVRRAIQRAGLRGFSWAFGQDADVGVKPTHGNDFRISWAGDSFTVTLPFSDRASVENALHCVALLLYLKYDPSVVRDRLSSLRSIPMRLELKEGINNCEIIDDSYNNDLMGLRISIEFLLNQKQKTKKRLILSDIQQSGLSDEALSEQVAELIHDSGIDSFVAIGPAMGRNRHLFGSNAAFFPDTESFLASFDASDYSDEVILIKGARSFRFEQIVSRLQRKVHGTVMEIDLGALAHNLNYFRSRIADGTKIMVMVKAFAYGSGSIEIANVLQYHRVDYMGVAYADEGVELRKNNIEVPIMVMNPSEGSFSLISEYRLEPEIYSLSILRSLVGYLGSATPCTIHVKLDTGMHRLGFEPHDLDELTEILRTYPNIEVGSVFSHLAGADEPAHDAFSMLQARRFEEMADRITRSLGYKPLYHILNSPGILRLGNLHYDMVRLGIGLYGIDPTGSGLDLRPVARLKTIVSQVRKVGPGETIGYGRRGTTENEARIATLAIGYADGFSRAFSHGRGAVLIHGKMAPVVGNVCMDMTMVDVTGIPVQEGDEAIIFGPELPIEAVAQRIGTIPYEILTNTSERVRRIFVAESI